MKYRIFDIEADGLLDSLTKIHCLSYYDLTDKVFESTTDYKEIKRLFEEDVIWVGHNIVRYDLPALAMKAGIKAPVFVVDTLALSWYLYPDRNDHGLEGWGEEFGVKKPVIKDWSSLTSQEYIHRCEEDVKINTILFRKEMKFLHEIYDDEEKEVEFMKYLHFKMDCCREQEEEGLKVDIDRIKANIITLTKEKENRKAELESIMPQVPVIKKKKLKDVAVSAQGQITKKGDLFYQDAIDNGSQVMSEYTQETITGYSKPNANSHTQLKSWLYSLGWVPQHIKHDRNKKTNEVKKIPQIKSKEKDSELCPSVKLLFEKEPKLAVLEGYFILGHRISILEGFLADQKDGYLYPTLSGLTNTLRLKHKIIVNLPAIYKPYGKEIRGSIIAKEGCVLMGADLANIEDRTKRHYIYKYDPAYVETMNTPGYDAHLEIALLAEFMTQEEVDFYKWYETELDLVSKKQSDYVPTQEDKDKYSRLKGLRNKSKVTNFSATYKVGAEALARNANIPLKEAKKLLAIYWERNKAILDIERDLTIVEIGSSRWLKNPINGFFYSLRSDKDKFSTLNQGSAVYMFDMWIKEVREQGKLVPFQYHDEILLNVKEDELEKDRAIVLTAMERLNEKIPLNVPIGCSINVGLNYAETH